MLFAVIVRNQSVWLGPDYGVRQQLGYLPDLRVEPKLSAGVLSVLWLPDPKPHYRRWEKTTITAGTIDIRFKDYFDWDDWGYRTWEYIEGRVVRAPDQPELENKDVLIEARQANIIYDQSRVVDIPEATGTRTSIKMITRIGTFRNTDPGDTSRLGSLKHQISRRWSAKT